jgi:hypothetical protein
VGGNQGKNKQMFAETRVASPLPSSLRALSLALVLKGGATHCEDDYSSEGTKPSIPRAFGATLGGLRGLTAQYPPRKRTSMPLNEDVAPYKDSRLNPVHESQLFAATILKKYLDSVDLTYG